MKKKSIFPILVIGFFCPLLLPAQVKQTTQEEQIWLGYFNQSRLSKKWSVGAELQLRTKEQLIRGLNQFMFRTNVTYFLSEEARLSAGYAWVNYFPGDNHKNISQPEHRPWQQFQWFTKYPRLRLMQWLRLEERFRRKIKNDDAWADGYSFNWRLRYNVVAQFPLNKNAYAPGTFSLAASNEVFINFGKQILYNYFDQNRFFIGLQYHLNKRDLLQAGYLNQFQQLSSGYLFRDLHNVRLFYFHNLNFEKGL